VEEAEEMAKGKDLILGCGLALITCVMWLVSSCTQSGTNSVPNQPVKVLNSTVANSTPTIEPPTLSNSTTVINSTTATQSPAITNSTTIENQTTTVSPVTAGTSTTPTTAILPPIVTTTTPFYDVDINSYKLTISGDVNTSLSLSYSQILAYPATTQTARIICPGEEDETDQWTGVMLSTLLNAAGLMPEATEVVITGLDGYYIQLPIASVLGSDVFLAYQMNGQTLTWDRGYPLRLVLTKNLVGADWPRWVSSIQIKSSLTSFYNSSAIIQNVRSNIPTSGSKTCSCFLAAAVANYQVVQVDEMKADQNDSLQNQEKL
jgi:DMSO/TMAO reductase YedYZ molybdopterin-dependent catalytic subunit